MYFRIFGTIFRICRHLEGALNEFEPDVLIYNAGTDILDGDPLGCLSISAQVIIRPFHCDV